MNVTTQELGAERWAEYFDSIGPAIEGLLVTVEVMSDELGDQIDVERLPVQTIGYDHRDNVLEVAVGGRTPRYPVVFRHFIASPQTIQVEDSGQPAPSAILVTDANGDRTLIRLFKPATIEA